MGSYSSLLSLGLNSSRTLFCIAKHCQVEKEKKKEIYIHLKFKVTGHKIPAGSYISQNNRNGQFL